MTGSVRILAGAIAAICWSGLALQMLLILQATNAVAAGGTLTFPVLAAGVVFVSFLTLQITLVAAAVTTCAAAGVACINGRGVRSAIAAYEVAGSIIYTLTLQPYWHHTGSQFLADLMLHGVTPVLYAAFWLLAVPKGDLRWGDPLRWLLYPAIYLAVLLFAAQWTGFYPYPFIDVRALDFLSLVFNLLALALTFLCSGLATVAVARMVESPNTSIDRRERSA